MNTLQDTIKVCCRQCGGAELIDRNLIVQESLFCGVKIPLDWQSGRLLTCTGCHLTFRYPIRTPEEYASLYRAAPEETYKSTSLRTDQELIRRFLFDNLPEGSVLDVGCFDGALLRSLGTTYQKFGIEASLAAARICTQNKIAVLAESAESLISIQAKFDAITAVDVIEHLIEPEKFVQTALNRLNPGGLLLISTGDAEHPLWRFAGGRYWYCAFPEHISFISPKWIRAVAAKNLADVLIIQHFKHHNPAISKLKIIYSFFGRIIRATAEIGVAAVKTKSPTQNPRNRIGYPGMAKDHIFVVLRRATTSS